MSEQFLDEYFENIAAKLKEIQHTENEPAFYRITDPYNLDEFDDAVKSMGKPVCLLLEIGDGEIGEWDSQKDMPRIGLHVLAKCDGSRAGIRQARDQAKEILLKIVSRMRRDAQDHWDDQGAHIIGALKAAKVVFSTAIKFTNMTAVDGNWYGKSFWFEFKAPVNLVYNEGDWIE
ncbi:hypothetical protein EOD41_10720 [Mucilaginibacter limnophilus]|uniref:Uncharacterized protein n=1 Tax=Mucilaginibacter limnophilus TaxID=1932778 RepID=A0A3S2UM45_9SPHI|nr:hypothetical protein [Mucilaginibacter limnophilus]RVU01079.1 hypothetical protein EOD41_10720 [Mucilaginibacter limnophilus]